MDKSVLELYRQSAKRCKQETAMMMEVLDTNEVEQASETASAQEEDETPASEPAAVPIGPLTYEQMTEATLEDAADLLSMTQVSKPTDGQVQLSAKSSLAESEASREQSESIHGQKRKRSGTLDPESTDGGQLLLQHSGAEMEPSSCFYMLPQLLANAILLEWGSLPQPLIHMVLSQLDHRTQGRCRLVSKYWKLRVDGDVKELRPCKAVSAFYVNFVRLVAVDFSCCEVRNRHLFWLADAGLRIEEMRLGHPTQDAANKPGRITNEGMEYLTYMDSLKSLTFYDCNAFTNRGLMKLEWLSDLEELNLIRCERISDKGLDFLPYMPRLHSLAIFQCRKVSEKILSLLGEMQSLKLVHLSNFRITLEGMEGFQPSSDCKLEEFGVHDLKIERRLQSVFFFAALAKMTGLKALSLTAIPKVSLRMTMNLLRQLTNLEGINLGWLDPINDPELTEISTSLPNLQHLKMLLGPAVTRAGLEALAKLPNLQGCAFKCSKASPLTLQAMSTLKDLTHVELPGCTITPALMHALGAMTKLQLLSLRGQQSYTPQLPTADQPEDTASSPNQALADPLQSELLDPLTGLVHLKSLDMTDTNLNFTVASTFLHKLMRRDQSKRLRRPVLENFCLLGCAIDEAGIATMNELHQDILCHKNNPTALISSTWVGGRNTAFRA